MIDSKVVEIGDVKCLRETDKALQLIVDGVDVWVPKSVIDETSEVLKKGDHGELTIAEWFAQKQGWLG